MSTGMIFVLVQNWKYLSIFAYYWLYYVHKIDSVKVLHPTQHKIGHFGDIPQASLLAWYGK